MNSSANKNDGQRKLRVEWQDSPAVGPMPLVRRKLGRAFRILLPARRGPRQVIRVGEEGAAGFRLPFRRQGAFTLLELMMVIAIIGFVAGMVFSHLGNFGRANVMTAATRQILDDLGLARQRALSSRSTVYMVFLPPGFWNDPYYTPTLQEARLGYLAPKGNQVTNLVMHQYTAYALVSLSTVGDQPGVHTPHFITDWRTLPDGVFFSPMQFTNLYDPSYPNYPNYVKAPPYITTYTTNTLSGIVVTNPIYPWNTNFFPFPSAYPPNSLMDLPCIGFSPRGSLTVGVDQSIMLARGSIFYPTDTNGVPLMTIPPTLPNLAENPPGNDTNNPNVIQIDWLTGRATLMQNQLQ